MFKLLWNSVFPCIFLTFYGAECVEWKQPRLNIIGGNTTDISLHPYQVSVWADGELRGSGALVREDWVVTTASNVAGFDKNSFIVRAHSSHASDGGKVYTINTILIHPKFRFNNMSYDVALMKLSYVMMTALINTIPISTNPLPDNVTGVLTGYGSTSNSTKMSNQLRQVSSRVVDKPSCQLVYGEDFMIGVSQFCAQSDNVFGPCWGDNGDLLVSEGTLYGLLSWNRGCFDVAEPSVFTDLSLSLHWINRAIRKHDRQPQKHKP